MKQATAQLRYLHMAPRKVRLVATTIQGLSVNEAEAQLTIRHKRASGPLLKLLRSAKANAKNKNLSAEKLVVSSIRVDGGPMYKRSLPRAMGRATPIQKKTCHVMVILQEGDKIFPMRYTMVTSKKEKNKGKKPAKKITPSLKRGDSKPGDKPTTDKTLGRPGKTEERGFFQKMFRRKIV